MDEGGPIVSKGDLQQFLTHYPGMSIAPARGAGLVLHGTFCYCGTPPSAEEVCDCYDLDIHVPPVFPNDLPSVWEVGGRIPRDSDHHTFRNGSLCLGSEIRLRDNVFSKPTLVGFVESCLVPYLYATSRRLAGERTFCFGELAHGKRGVLDDYASMFGLDGDDRVIVAMGLLGMKRGIANKKPCPCGCGLRLGRCRLHLRLSRYRKVASRAWFRKHLKELQDSV